jgi:hypothetical protein
MWHLGHWEEILHSIVPEVKRNLAKAQQIHAQSIKQVSQEQEISSLESVLHKKPGDNPHGGGK